MNFLRLVLRVNNMGYPKGVKGIAFLIVFASNVLVGQHHVVDSKSKKPIPSVHIGFGVNEGTITNTDGYFEIPSSEKFDTLRLSHISYRIENISSTKFRKSDTIFLQELPINLDEVVLQRFNSKDTLLKAINRINKNYLNASSNLFGFFRHSLEEGSKGVELIEVDLISYTKDFNSEYSVKINNAKRTENYSELSLEIFDGVLGVLKKGDLVKRKAGFLNPSNIDKFKFNYAGFLDKGDFRVYKIIYSSVGKSSPNLKRGGDIFIDSKSLAFIEISYVSEMPEFSESKKKLEQKKASQKPVFRLKNITNRVKYMRLPNDKWVLSFVEIKNKRLGLYRNDSFIYDLTGKLVVNNVKIKNPIPIKTNYNLSRSFNRVVKKFKKFDNWENNPKFSLSKRERKILNDINSIKD